MRHGDHTWGLMMIDMPNWFHRTLSSPRLAPYLKATSGDNDAAVRLYWWNVEVSAAFYPPLHLLEVGLRNSMHTRLGTMFGRSDWWETADIGDNGTRMVGDAKKKVLRRIGTSGGPDDVVTELSFGFWVSLLSRTHDRHLWVPGLHGAFRHFKGRRRDLHETMTTTVLFRNRIMHHEPIHHRHLEADHASLHRQLGYLSPHLVDCVVPHDRVPQVLALRPRVGGERR